MFHNASAFDKDLSRWCVTTYPSNYHSGYGRFTNVNPYLNHTTFHPKWGTCPEPYNTFDTTWNIPANDKTLIIPTYAGLEYDFTIDW